MVVGGIVKGVGVGCFGVVVVVLLIFNGGVTSACVVVVVFVVVVRMFCCFVLVNLFCFHCCFSDLPFFHTCGC